MLPYYNSKANKFRYASPAAIAVVAGLALLILSALVLMLKCLLVIMAGAAPLDSVDVSAAAIIMLEVGASTAGLGLVFTILGLVFCFCMSKTERIYFQSRRALFASRFGNPLNLKDGERLPKLVTARAAKNGRFLLRVYASCVTVDELSRVATAISSGLKGKLKNYAVVGVEPSVAAGYVDFYIEDVAIDHQIIVCDINQLRPSDSKKLIVQQNVELDLQYAGSMLVVGRTRSGKTSAVMSLLMGVLLQGRDNYGSQIVIVDPKSAELSRASKHVLTLDDDGGARAILAAVKEFDVTIRKRQAVLNDASEKSGNAEKWFDIGMKPSYLFLDEWVSLLSAYPKKPSKNEPDYSLDAFMAVIRRIITMGASAGCFCIISLPEASVQEGGIPAMLRSAMGTRILFKPTLDEGRLVWDVEKLKALPERTYTAGQAWLSSADGVLDSPQVVHFPRLDLPEYSELGRLLDKYYE